MLAASSSTSTSRAATMWSSSRSSASSRAIGICFLLARVGGQKSKFLCGHGERHWFVAAVPESARGVSGVVEAMRALQPDGVRDAVAQTRPKDPLRRKNAAYVRQGEWFFVPAPDLVVDTDAVRHD